MDSKYYGKINVAINASNASLSGSNGFSCYASDLLAKHDNSEENHSGSFNWWFSVSFDGSYESRRSTDSFDSAKQMMIN